MTIVDTITTAPDKKLTTAETVRDEIGLSTLKDDHFIDRLINEASQAIVSYTNREFAEEEVKERVPGFDSPELIVSRTPIKSISEVSYDGETVINSDDYRIGDPDSGFIYRIDYIWQSTERVRYNLEPRWAVDSPEPEWVVTYTGGYVLPSSNWTETRDLPYDIERACIETVKAWFLSRQRDPNLVSMRVNGAFSAEYTQFGIPVSAAEMLKPYVRIL